ncbi:MAG TPA: hypothetical protein VHM91_05620, partial [Verrucomicrobiales bacterium]|nr:hypothetical protein [Verrucomicrobiales bacterium]
VTGVTASSSVLQPGFPFVVTYKTQSAAGQPVLVDASLHRTGTDPITDLPNVVSRLVPAGTGSITRNFNLPLSSPPGGYTLYVRLVQDYNGNGVIDAFETIIADMRVPVSVATPGPLVDKLAVSPAVIAPGQPATITATVTALPGKTLTTLRLFRSEGQSGPGAWTQVQTRSLSNVSSYQASFADNPPTIRRHWYALQAVDNAGQTAPAGYNFQPVSVLVTINDSQPPVITWSSPADGAVNSTNGNFTGTVTDNDRVESTFYRVDDGEWKYLSLISNNWYMAPSDEAGPHQVTIRTMDRSGNTVEQSRTYYRTPVAGGTDFDEDQVFTGPSDHNPNWQLSLMGDAQITGGRIDAPNQGDSATFSRRKLVPSWAKSAEVSYQCGPTGSSFSWNRNGFGPIVVRLVPGGPGPWQLQSGPQANPITIPLASFTANASTRLSVLIRVTGLQWYCRVVLAGAAPLTLVESMQTISNLTVFPLEDATFQTGTPAQSGSLNGGPGWLDDISFRAFRSFQSFDCRELRPLTLTATERPFTVNWGSVPGRFYQLETLNTGTGQWTPVGGIVPATGILTSQNLTFPRIRPSAMVRARQLQP